MASHIAIDPEAEAAVLGVLLVAPTRFAETVSRLSPADFSNYQHGMLYEAIGAGVANYGDFDISMVPEGIDPQMVHDLFYAQTPSQGLLGRNIERVTHAAAHRRLIHLLDDASHTLQDIDSDARVVLAGLAEVAKDCYPNPDVVDGYHLYDDWAMTASQSPRHWVIPGVLRKQGRMLIVGAEGSGKSVLLRQMAVMAAAGLHPFKGGAQMNPVKVLVVDLENDPATGMDENAVIDPASPLGLVIAAERAAPDRDRNLLRVWSRPDGIDLRNHRDVASLERILAEFAPDLVTFGPLYKAYRKTKGEDDEMLGAALQTVLDRLRITYDCSFIFEHHAPHDRTRLRPFGSSLWLRWPDIGIGLEPVDNDPESFKLARFRGDRYKVDAVPDFIRRGKVTWPWIPA